MVLAAKQILLFSGRATSRVYGSNDTDSLIHYLYFYSQKMYKHDHVLCPHSYVAISRMIECPNQFPVCPYDLCHPGYPPFHCLVLARRLDVDVTSVSSASKYSSQTSRCPATSAKQIIPVPSTRDDEKK